MKRKETLLLIMLRTDRKGRMLAVMTLVLHFIFVALLIVMSVQTGSSEEVFRITTSEWLPMISPDLEGYGPLCQAVTEAFALEGISVKYGFFPWKRAVVYVEYGDWDGTIIWTYTPEREKLMDYSDPIFTETMNFFHLKTFAFDWKTMEDLKKLRIGATIGYNYGKAFNKAAESQMINVEWISEDKRNFMKLLAQRIDIFPIELGAGYAFLDKYFTPELRGSVTHHSLPLKEQTYHLLFSKKIERNTRMIELFNRGLKLLRESGKLDHYLNLHP